MLGVGKEVAKVLGDDTSIGGIVLLNGTAKSTQTRTTRGFLFLTGISSTLLLIFYVGYEWFRLSGNHDLEASTEALLYLLTLIFWVVAIESLVRAGAGRRKKSIASFARVALGLLIWVGGCAAPDAPGAPIEPGAPRPGHGRRLVGAHPGVAIDSIRPTDVEMPVGGWGGACPTDGWWQRRLTPPR